MTQPVHEPPIVPKEYSGQWIAWNRDRTEIVASGLTADEAEDRALEKGEDSPVLAKVPLHAEPYAGPTVPKEYTGKWIVWNFNRTRIIASGTTFKEAEEAAAQTGEVRPVFSSSKAAGVAGDALNLIPASVELELADFNESYRRKVTASFAALDAAEDDTALLGHANCLEFFKVIFDGERREVELSLNRKFPVAQ